MSDSDIKGYCKKVKGVNGKNVTLISFRNGFIPDDDKFVYLLLGPLNNKNKSLIDDKPRSDFLIVERERREESTS